MSIYTNTLTKFAFADAIAVNVMKNMDPKDPNFKRFIDLQIAARNALTLWPGGTLEQRTVNKLLLKLRRFVDKMGWEYEPTYTHVMLNFSLAQMTDLLEVFIVNGKRRDLIMYIGEALNQLYLNLPQAHDDNFCIDEGLRAAEVWKEIME